MNLCYCFHGKLKDDYEDWEKWIRDVYEIFEAVGNKPTHYYMITESSGNGKAHRIGGILRRLKNIRRRKEKICDCYLVVWPDEIGSCIFDWTIEARRAVSSTGDYLYLAIHLGMSAPDEDFIVAKLLGNIDEAGGKICQIGNQERPGVYTDAASIRDGRASEAFLDDPMELIATASEEENAAKYKNYKVLRTFLGYEE